MNATRELTLILKQNRLCAYPNAEENLNEKNAQRRIRIKHC